jgi:hypothetical protein
MRTYAIDHQGEQQEYKSTTQVAELAALGQLIRVACHGVSVVPRVEVIAGR